LRALGARTRRASATRGWRADYALLAYSCGPAAKDVYAAPDDGLRRDAGPDAGRLGPVLSALRCLAALALYAESARAACVRLCLEAIPADVCEHRHRNRQRSQGTC